VGEYRKVCVAAACNNVFSCCSPPPLGEEGNMPCSTICIYTCRCVWKIMLFVNNKCSGVWTAMFLLSFFATCTSVTTMSGCMHI
jgi:hypothetical protein